jgi:hypothetical protein
MDSFKIPENMKPDIKGPYSSKSKPGLFIYKIYGEDVILPKEQIDNIIKMYLEKKSTREKNIKEYVKNISGPFTSKSKPGRLFYKIYNNTIFLTKEDYDNITKIYIDNKPTRQKNIEAYIKSVTKSIIPKLHNNSTNVGKGPRAPPYKPPEGSDMMASLVSGLSSMRLDSISSKIETNIIQKYNPEDKDIMNIRQNGNIADFFIEGTPNDLLQGKPIDIYKKSLGLEDFAVVENSGGGYNDCLIISFLMGISPAYRRLSYVNKYNFARDFRTKHFVELINKDPRTTKLKEDSKNALVAYIKSSRMLDDSVIPFLANLFKINILQLEKYKEGRIEGLAGLQIQPPSATLVTNAKYISEGHYPSGIIIINIGNFHYEIVRQNTNKYIFSYEELIALYNKINNSPLLAYTPEGRVLHGFKDDSVVYVKGQGDKQFKVVDRRFGNGPNNIQYYTLDNGSKVGPNNLADVPFVVGTFNSSWICPKCTFNNTGYSTICKMCGTSRDIKAANLPPKSSSRMTLRSSVVSRNAKITQLMAKGASNKQAVFALNASANNVSQAERLLISQGIKLSGGKRTHSHKTKRRLH